MKTSVIITTKNRPQLFREALRSVYNQTVKPDEIIVIDDASSLDYDVFFDTQKIPIIHHKLDTSLGVANARNVGVSLASCDVIFFLDDDDIWNNNHIDSHLRCHYNPDIVMCFSKKELFFGSENNIIRTTKNIEPIESNILSENYIGTPSGVSIKRKYLGGDCIFDVNLPALEDYDLWLQLILKVGNEKIHFVDIPTVKYRISSPKKTNVSHNLRNHEIARIRIIKKNQGKLTCQELKIIDKYLRFCLLKTAHRNSYYRMIRLLFKYPVFTMKTIVLL
ncbi:TPA: glycosyltransferase family 2 protein, partial [Escherichia coli]|nr:glycosyltransferase family 2 protein [Escherichia coli]